MGDMENNKVISDQSDKAEARCEDEAASVGGDMFTDLPDDILLNILERLDTLDALRTCILSKLMLRLPAMLSCFDIHICSLARHSIKANAYTTAHAVPYNNALASITEKIMSARNLEIPIRKLRIASYCMPDDCISMSKAVARSMATEKIEDFEFALISLKLYRYCTPDDLLCYAKRFNSWFGDCPATFAGLTRLWLQNMTFGEPDIPNILSTCKRLQSLRLSSCDTGVRSVLLVEHPQLVELHIEYGRFETVQLICLPKLQHMKYTGWLYQNPMTFCSVPQLSKLSLEKMGTKYTKNIQLSQLLSSIPLISNLHLDFQSEKIWVVPECPKLLAPVLSKLQIVNMVNLPEGCNINWTLFILEAAPRLKELRITVWDNLCRMVRDKESRKRNGLCEKTNVEWQPSSFDFEHNNLVKLTIRGFQHDELFVRYVRRVMEVAVNTLEISLLDWEACKRCELFPEIKVSPSRYPQMDVEKNLLREEINKGLHIASRAVIHFGS